MYKCNNCGNTSKKEFIKCPMGSCGFVGGYVDVGEIKKNYSIPKVSEKRKLEIASNVGVVSELDKWFEYQLERVNENSLCENCDSSIWWLKQETYRKSICAHILPKRTFKSVETDKDNCLLLCLTCHANYDSSWLNASKMPIFKKAKAVVQNILWDKIKEKSKLNELLIK